MQTAFSITNVSPTAQLVGGEGASITYGLTVTFHINNRGPSHVAGMIVTTDSWVTHHVVPAIFLNFDQNFELWSTADFEVTVAEPDASGMTFEFVIFCDDFGGNNSVPRIWNTNGGTRFQAHVRLI